MPTPSSANGGINKGAGPGEVQGQGEDMSDKSVEGKEALNLKCPECRAPLKQRRSRTPNECELVCGGCGAMFDVCDLDTVEELKKKQ